jgi:hypothetical protein
LERRPYLLPSPILLPHLWPLLGFQLPPPIAPASIDNQSPSHQLLLPISPWTKIRIRIKVKVEPKRKHRPLSKLQAQLGHKLNRKLRLGFSIKLKHKLKLSFGLMPTPKLKPRFKLKPKPRLSRDTMDTINLLYRHTILFNISSRSIINPILIMDTLKLPHNSLSILGIHYIVYQNPHAQCAGTFLPLHT